MTQTSQFPKGYFSASYSTRIPTKEELDRDLAPFKHTLVQFIKKLPKNAKILDAGCGVGKALKTVMAYRSDVKVYAMDITDMSGYIPKEVPFQIGVVEKVQEMYEENFFDAIICQHVFEHLLYPMPAMEAFKKVLKNEGELFLETPNWSRAILPFSETFFWNDYTHIRIFTKFTMERLFHDYNFDIKEMKTVSSSGMTVRDDSVSKVKKVFQKENRNWGRFFKKVVRVGFIRIVSPFLKDILIVIGVNKK